MTCQQELMALGKPYPRTCEDCGLFGPCKKTVASGAVRFPKPSLWLAIAKDGRVKYTTDSSRAQAWKDSGSYRLVRDYYTEPPKQSDTTMQCSYPKCQATNGCSGPCALLPKQPEPVAWMHNMIEGVVTTNCPTIDLKRHPERWTALYKDPTPCQTCQALSRTVMMDQTSHDTAPPEREWVGLTDDEMYRLWLTTDEMTDRHALIKKTEAKLKEKNT